MGGAIWYRARCELRSSWRFAVVLVVLLGIAGGAVMAAGAGSRRTASAYSRMFEASEGFDIFVNPDDGDTDFDAIEALPEVAEAGRISGPGVALLTADGELDESVNVLLGVSDGRFAYELVRPVQIEGRLPDQAADDEVFFPRGLAHERGLSVGDTVPMAYFTDEETAPTAFDATVVGIGVFPTDALQNSEGFEQTQTVMLPPGFLEQHPDVPVFFSGTFVRFVPGADEHAFRQAALRVAREEVYFQSRVEAQTKAQRALQPYTTTLAAFAVIAGIASLVIFGQALARHVVGAASERRTLAAVGMRPAQELAVTALRAAVIGIGGGLLAVMLAIAVSAKMPIGPARSFEPDPGIDVDRPVLLPGGITIVLASLAIGAGASLLARRAVGRPAPIARPSAIAGWLDRHLQHPPIAAGARMALEPGTGPRSVPVRTTLAGAMFGVAIVVAVLTFAGALDKLLDTPRLYGWSWDAIFITNTENEESADVADTLRGTDGVTEATGGEYGQLDVDGLSVAAIGLDPAGVELPQLAGQPARSDDEIVLGTTTLRRIHRHVGDHVTVSTGLEEREMTVVGTVTFPRFAAYPGADKTGLGDGAAITRAAMMELLPSTIEGDGAADFYLIRGDEVGVDALASAYPATFAEETLGILVPDAQRPDDLTGYDDVNRTPLLLAGLLALLAAGATGHGVIQATRRRRHDLAVLRALGFTRSQVRQTVRWQAVTVALLAVVVGLPAGVALGRVAWSALAERLGTSAPPVTPWLAVLATVPTVLALLMAVASVPARRIATTSAAYVLRSE